MRGVFWYHRGLRPRQYYISEQESWGKNVIFSKKYLVIRKIYLSLHRVKPVRAWMGCKK
jgi:hypothetical protein